MNFPKLTAKSLNLVKTDSTDTLSEYRGKPFFGVEVTVFKKRGGDWRIDGTVDGIEISEEHRTLAAALSSINEHGFTMVPTRNILSGRTGMINRNRKNTCSDPATERYHSM